MRSATHSPLRTLALAATLLAGAETGHAESAVEHWLNQSSATGDWGGARNRLEELGITPALTFYTDILGNPVGGIKQSAAYAGVWYGRATFDMERLADINGMTLFVSAAWQQGRNLSADAIGNAFTVSEVFGEPTVRLSQTYLEQSLFNDRINIAFGRLAAGDDFAATDAFQYYVSSAVDRNPSGVKTNATSFAVSPLAQWGARAKVKPAKDLYVAGGVYNADPNLRAADLNGADFTLNPQDGVLLLAEVGWTPGERNPITSAPGHYSLGVWVDTSKYQFVDGSRRSRFGNFGIYGIAQQMIYQERAGGDEGLTLWGTINVAPESDLSLFPFSFFAGAYYQGLFPHRPKDKTAFGIFYGDFSENLVGQSYELVLELNHRFQVSEWFFVQPDLQYVINPDGGGINNALVAGVEIAIDF